MISFHNEKMAPPILCKLLHDAVPEECHVPVVFSYGKHTLPKRFLRDGFFMGITDYSLVCLDLRRIHSHARRDCALDAGIWYGMLKTGFHEFGHIAGRHDEIPWWEKTDALELEADAWAYERMDAVLRWDKRLFQPFYLGVVSVVKNRRKWAPFRPGSADSARSPHLRVPWVYIHDYRCKITAGQLSVGHVAQKVFDLPPDGDHYTRRAIRLVHKYGDDLARVHVDSAGRRHCLWTWGDVPVILGRVKRPHQGHHAVNGIEFSLKGAEVIHRRR